MTFTGATPTGGSIGGSFANGSRLYTDTPTTIIADDALRAYAGRNTMLAGAGLWSKTGNLKLDTGDFVFDNYNNHDTYTAASASLSVTLGANHPWDGTLSAQYRNQSGLTFATMGAGDINIRNRPNLDISGLNRDVNNMSVVTSRTSWSFATPALNLFKLYDDLSLARNTINTLAAGVPQAVKDKGDSGVRAYQRLMLNGLSEDQARSVIGSELFNGVVAKMDALAAIRASGRTPDKFDLLLLAQGETLLFGSASKYSGGSIMVDCPQNGTRCEIALDFFKASVANDPKFVSNVLAGLLFKTSGTLGTASSFTALNNAAEAFNTLLQCSLYEPATFARFVGATSWAERPAGLDALISTLAAARGTTIENLRAFSNDWAATFGGYATNPSSPTAVLLMQKYGLDRIIPSTGDPSTDPRLNGRANDQSGLFVDAALIGVPGAKAVVTGVRFIGTRLLLGATEEVVVLGAEGTAAKAILDGLVTQGRATIDASGRYLVAAGDPVASKTLGNFGEARLADELGLGFKSTEETFSVTLPNGTLTTRRVDAFDKGTIYEVKAGVDATLTSAIKQQVEGDLYLLATNPDVKAIKWVFYQGADPKLLNYLAGKGIPFVVK